MADITPRPNRTPRRAREQRAFRLVQIGGASAVLGVLYGIVALVTPLGMGPAFLLIAVAILCGVLFRRTTS